MKTKKLLALVLASAMMLGALTACGGESGSSNNAGANTAASTAKTDDGAGAAAETPSYVNKTGLPIVNEPITLTIMINKNVSDLSNSYQEKECVQRAQTETGITLDFTEISAAAWAEQVGVIMASNELPDVTVGTIANFGKYLDSFMPLNDLIAEYAPAVTAFYEKRPDLRTAGTMEDGEMYSLPTFQQNGFYTHSNRYGINKEWLERVGKDIPTTQDELFDVLMAFKEQDANGNGDPNDELPFSFTGNTAVALDMNSYGLNFLMNSCGVHSMNYVEIENDTVSFAPTNEEYRDFLTFANKLYANGLIDPDSFVQQTADFLAKGTAGRIGVIAHHSYIDIVCGADKMDQYVPMLPMQDKNGEIVVTGRPIDGDFWYNAYSISRQSKYAEAAVRLYDYVQGDNEILTLWSWGPEGKVYTVNDEGMKVKVTEFPEGMTNFAQARQTFSAGMSGFWIYPKEQYINTWVQQPRDELMMEFEELYTPYLCTPMPQGIDKQEVVERRNDQFTEINTYIQNFTAQSIMDGIDDAAWQKHLDTCKKLNVEQYVEDYQNFYNEKKAN